MIPSATAKWVSSFRRIEPALHSARAVALAVVIVAFPLASAEASGRLCLGMIVTSAAGESEQQAKRSALEAWRAKATELGREFEAWRLSIDRSLDCVAAQSGYVCRAGARPCSHARAQGVPKQSAAR
jgi:hypothetical protein